MLNFLNILYAIIIIIRLYMSSRHVLAERRLLWLLAACEASVPWQRRRLVVECDNILFTFALASISATMKFVILFNLHKILGSSHMKFDVTKHTEI